MALRARRDHRRAVPRDRSPRGADLDEEVILQAFEPPVPRIDFVAQAAVPRPRRGRRTAATPRGRRSPIPGSSIRFRDEAIKSLLLRSWESEEYTARPRSNPLPKLRLKRSRTHRIAPRAGPAFPVAVVVRAENGEPEYRAPAGTPPSPALHRTRSTGSGTG